jgi:hypothetical protein
MTFTHLSEVIRKRLGWCPEGRTIRAAPAAVTVPPVTANSPVPEGGSGGSGRIDRGIKLALGSIRILVKNKRLLWFSLLIGLAILFSLAATMFIQIISGTNPLPGTTFVADFGVSLLEKGSIPWFALTFSIAFISTFLTLCLLGGLYVCASSIFLGKTVSIREGLSRVGKYLRPLAGWTLIGAVFGTVFSFTTNGSPASIPVTFGSVIITAIFGILTIFVVPGIVLDNEGLLTAIWKSLSLVRKIWGEIVVCAGIFLLIVFAIELVTLVPIISIGFSTGSTGMVGTAIVLTMLVWAVILFIGSTLVGIATLGLYMYAKTDRLPESFISSPGGRQLS